MDELCETVDCFVHPSVREGLGIAPLEAMAAGLPLITATVNGIKDYTEDGVSGCCIAPNDVDAMVIAITRMKNDKTFRRILAPLRSTIRIFRSFRFLLPDRRRAGARPSQCDYRKNDFD